MKMEDINYGTGNETLWKCNSCGNRIIGMLQWNLRIHLPVFLTI